MNSGTVVTHEPQAWEEKENCEEKGSEAERSQRLDGSETFSSTMRSEGI